MTRPQLNICSTITIDAFFPIQEVLFGCTPHDVLKYPIKICYAIKTTGVCYIRYAFEMVAMQAITYLINTEPIEISDECLTRVFFEIPTECLRGKISSPGYAFQRQLFPKMMIDIMVYG